MTSQAYRIETFSYLAVCQTMLDQFATTRTSLQDPNTRHSSHKKDRQGREITAVGGAGRILIIESLNKVNQLEQKAAASKARIPSSKGSSLSGMKPCFGWLVGDYEA